MFQMAFTVWLYWYDSGDLNGERWKVFVGDSRSCVFEYISILAKSCDAQGRNTCPLSGAHLAQQVIPPRPDSSPGSFVPDAALSRLALEGPAGFAVFRKRKQSTERKPQRKGEATR